MTEQAWQYLVALLCVAGAGLYVARRIRRTFAPRKAEQIDGTCGSCAGCNSAPTASSQSSAHGGFISLDSLRREPGHQ